MQQTLLSGLAALRRNAPGPLGWAAQEQDPANVATLIHFLDELKHWNRAYNLTAIDDPEQMAIRHVLDSLSVASWVHGRVLDVGTGAGLPGIPLAIMNAEIDMILLDRTAKKVRFLNHVTRALKLQNVEAVHSRIDAFRSLMPFDAIISRAFSSLADYARSTRHLLGPRSRLLGMKGKFPEDEIADLPDWISIEAIEKLAVPGLHEDRHLVIMSLI